MQIDGLRNMIDRPCFCRSLLVELQQTFCPLWITVDSKKLQTRQYPPTRSSADGALPLLLAYIWKPHEGISLCCKHPEYIRNIKAAEMIALNNNTPPAHNTKDSFQTRVVSSNEN